MARKTGIKPARRFNRRAATPYILLAPILIYVALLMIWPMINVYVMSLQNYQLLKPKERAFIGFTNYINIFTKDKLFFKALGNSFWWVVISVAIQTVLGFSLAMLLNQKFKGRGLYRALVLSPWAVAGVMVGIIWSLIYGETYGVLNDILKHIGIIDRNISALSSISDDIYESATIDGANGVVTLFKITIPMIKDTIILTTLLRSIWTFNAVDLIYSLTYGGPNNATLTVPLYVMTTFKTKLDYGYASALAGVATIMMMGFAVAYIKMGKLGKEGMY